MFGLIIDLLGAILGPLMQEIKELFVKPPEEKVREDDAKKINKTITRLSDPSDPGFIVRDSAKQDVWGLPTNPSTRMEPPK